VAVEGAVLLLQVLPPLALVVASLALVLTSLALQALTRSPMPLASATGSLQRLRL
jgi:hypothetical protein